MSHRLAIHRYGLLSQRLTGVDLYPIDAHPAGVEPWPSNAPGFLGRFPIAELVDEIEIHGISPVLLERGHEAIGLDVERTCPGRDVLRLSAPGVGLLVELSMWREYATCGAPVEIDGPLRLLAVEFLRSQRPGSVFERERLPGQDAPGMGIGNQVLALLETWGARLRADAVLTLPDHFHSAVLYERGFAFLDPDLTGLLQVAKRQALEHASLAVASWRFELGAYSLVGPLAPPAGGPWRWPSEAEVIPLSARVRDWIGSERYQTRASETASAHTFVLDPATAALADPRAAPEHR